MEAQGRKDCIKTWANATSTTEPAKAATTNNNNNKKVPLEQTRMQDFHQCNLEKKNEKKTHASPPRPTNKQRHRSANPCDTAPKKSSVQKKRRKPAVAMAGERERERERAYLKKSSMLKTKGTGDGA